MALQCSAENTRTSTSRVCGGRTQTCHTLWGIWASSPARGQQDRPAPDLDLAAVQPRMLRSILRVRFSSLTPASYTPPLYSICAVTRPPNPPSLSLPLPPLDDGCSCHIFYFNRVTDCNPIQANLSAILQQHAAPSLSNEGGLKALPAPLHLEG